MSLSLIGACIWALAANLIAMTPSKRGHWPLAYGLIAIGLPLLVWVFWQNGAVVGLVVLVAGASVLRWPVLYLARWLKRLIPGKT